VDAVAREWEPLVTSQAVGVRDRRRARLSGLLRPAVAGSTRGQLIAFELRGRSEKWNRAPH